jgi:acyl-homoserine-lactone acylase
MGAGGVRVVAAFAAFAIASAACSGDDDASSDTTDSTGSPSTSATQTASSPDTVTTEPPATQPVTTEPEFAYQATIRRTAHNIPHITADDYGGLGYGYGYAFAEDHLCSLADVVVQARSEAASFFGPGTDDAWLDQDLVYEALDLYERAAADLDAADPEPRAIIEGYAAGYNRYLADTGADAVNGYCAGEPWVRPIDEYDLAAYYKSLSWRASVDPLLGYIASATPPASPEALDPIPDNSAGADESATGAAGGAGLEQALAGLVPDASELASNAWAIGPDRTEDGTTMLVGNPHFPWQGALRFYEAHLTVPGEFDVYGVSLLGSPAINIGFTDGVAWSATVSAGRRFTAYTLDLVPGDPTRYVYGDEERAMTSRTVSVDVLAADGTTSPIERTFWFSHYGPVIDFPGLGWTDTQTLTFRDANAENDELIPQFMAMNQARSMDDLIDAHATWQGIPWVNTVAASADGRIWYADTSATPNLSDEAIAAWRTNVAADPITKVALDNGVILLDGSDPLYEWVDDPDARDPGVVPFDEMPQLERSDFLFNANDPFWFVNPDELLSGYSPAHGLEETPVSNRTRMNARQLSVDGGDAGADGLFTREELRDSSVSNRVFTAEMLVDEVVAECNAYAAVVRDPNGIWPQACDTLAAWDRRADIDSVGTALWREFIESFSGAELIDAGPLWAVGFDPADPLGTPNGLSPDADVPGRIAAAVLRLRTAGFDLDSPLGALQTTDRNGERVPVHGGTGTEGVTNVVGFGNNDTTSEPGVERGERIEGSRSLTTLGYPVSNGTSFIFDVEFGADGPVAEALLTYGESGDPTSPFFADQTELFSAKEWRPILFTPDAIAADAALREYTISE